MIDIAIPSIMTGWGGPTANKAHHLARHIKKVKYTSDEEAEAEALEADLFQLKRKRKQLNLTASAAYSKLTFWSLQV